MTLVADISNRSEVLVISPAVTPARCRGRFAPARTEVAGTAIRRQVVAVRTFRRGIVTVERPAGLVQVSLSRLVLMTVVTGYGAIAVSPVQVVARVAGGLARHIVGMLGIAAVVPARALGRFVAARPEVALITLGAQIVTA